MATFFDCGGDGGGVDAVQVDVVVYRWLLPLFDRETLAVLQFGRLCLG